MSDGDTDDLDRCKKDWKIFINRANLSYEFQTSQI